MIFSGLRDKLPNTRGTSYHMSCSIVVLCVSSLFGSVLANPATVYRCRDRIYNKPRSKNCQLIQLALYRPCLSVTLVHAALLICSSFKGWYPVTYTTVCGLARVPCMPIPIENRTKPVIFPPNTREITRLEDTDTGNPEPPPPSQTG